MKNVKFILSAIFILGLSFSPMIAEASCVSCSGSGPECTRVITPTGPHIFYGTKTACADQ